MNIFWTTILSIVLGVFLGLRSSCVTSTRLHVTDGNATIGFERTMDTGNGTAR